jgi:hypothetical protein
MLSLVKINLTHENGSPRFNLTNQDNLISDSELDKMLSEAHQLPFGDVLLEYLRLLKMPCTVTYTTVG